MQFDLVSRDILLHSLNINAFRELIIHLNKLSQPQPKIGILILVFIGGLNWMMDLCTSIVNLYNLFKHMVLAMILPCVKAMLW